MQRNVFDKKDCSKNANFQKFSNKNFHKIKFSFLLARFFAAILLYPSTSLCGKRNFLANCSTELKEQQLNRNSTPLKDKIKVKTE